MRRTSAVAFMNRRRRRRKTPGDKWPLSYVLLRTIAVDFSRFSISFLIVIIITSCFPNHPTKSFYAEKQRHLFRSYIQNIFLILHCCRIFNNKSLCIVCPFINGRLHYVLKMKFKSHFRHRIRLVLHYIH